MTRVNPANRRANRAIARWKMRSRLWAEAREKYGEEFDGNRVLITYEVGKILDAEFPEFVKRR